MLTTTASQTIGPFWHLLDDKAWADLTRFGATGDVITIEGRVFDGAGAPLTDACVELWQSSPEASELFPGFGRCASDITGLFRFKTLRPEPVRGPGNATQAPHVAITIMARGLLHHLNTRIYFPDEALNDNDPILSMIEDPERRATLIAEAAGGTVWRRDIYLQGGSETVFFDI